MKRNGKRYKEEQIIYALRQVDGGRRIGTMWRFSRSNAITEGFHRKMKLIQRRAYGFRNFNN